MTSSHGSAAIFTGTAGDVLEAKNDVQDRIRRGQQAPNKPTSLPIDAIELIPELFQPRSSGDWNSEAHVNSLSRAVRNSQEVSGKASLEPVLVYWVGDAWVCLDGHHRLAAISKNSRAGSKPTVSVEAYEGTLEDAMLESTRRNSRNKLMMSEYDKTERAWTLFLTGSYTHKAIHEACGVSTKTIQRMARAIGDAVAERAEAFRTMHWWQVRRVADDDALPMDRDAQRAEKVRRVGESLGRAMKNRPPDLIGDALIAMHPEIAQALLVHLKRNLELDEDFAPLGADGLPQFADVAPDF